MFVRPFYNDNNFVKSLVPSQHDVALPNRGMYTLRAANNVHFQLRRDAKYKLHLSVAVPKSACILINVE